MPMYDYVAKSGDGKRLKGVAKAVDVHALADELAARGLFLIDAAESRRAVSATPAPSPSLSTGSSSAPRRGRILRRAKLLELTSALAITYTAGIPIVEGLTDLETDQDDTYVRRVLREVRSRISQGEELGAAMAATGAFPSLYVALVASGERSGRLEMVFEDLVRFLEWQSELSAMIRKASIYPLAILAAVTGLLVLLLVVVFPALAQVFTGMQIELPLPTRILMWLAEAAQKWALWWGGALTLTLISLAIYARTERGTRTFHRLMLRTPYFGELHRKMLSSRFAHHMAIMMMSGIELIQALALTANIMQNRIFREAVIMIRDAVQSGATLADAAESTKTFPLLLVRMLRVGETTGTVDSTMQRISNTYDREVPTSIRTFFGVVEPVVLMLLGLVVGFLAVAVLLPVYQLQDSIQ